MSFVVKGFDVPPGREALSNRKNRPPRDLTQQRSRFLFPRDQVSLQETDPAGSLKHGSPAATGKFGGLHSFSGEGKTSGKQESFVRS